MRNRTWKDIESSRNTRLWLTDVVLPIIGTIGGLVMTAQLTGHDVIGKTKEKFVSVKAKAKAWKEAK